MAPTESFCGSRQIQVQVNAGTNFSTVNYYYNYITSPSGHMAASDSLIDSIYTCFHFFFFFKNTFLC